MVKINPLLNPYLAGDNQKLGILTSPLITKGWRLLLFHNRATSGMLKSDKQKNPGPIPNPKTKNTEVTQDLHDLRRGQILYDVQQQVYQGPSILPKTTREIINNITIINSYSSPPTTITIQGRPKEMEVNPEANWASVKSMGRNNPFMYYTGGEDVISFEISWYSIDDDREDVLTKCRLLEAWSRADGYSASPPILQIAWGNSEMFQDDSFVLTAAPYQLCNFQNSYRLGTRRNPGEIVDLKYLPNCATQQLTFKRVTAGNRTHAQIISPAKIAKASGINQ